MLDYKKIFYAGITILILGFLSKVKILLIIGAVLFIVSMVKKKKREESETV